MNRQSMQVRLNVEHLESRQLLTAGNITAKVIDGDLVIRAANPGNYSEAFRVRQIANDQFTIEGYNGTLVNGSTKVKLSGVFDDVRIYTYGGADKINLLGASNSSMMKVNGDLLITAGSGNDTITGKYVEVGGDIDINTKSGRDITKLRGVRAGDEFTIQDDSTFTKGDYDKVYVESCEAGFSTTNGTLKFDLNDGNDRVYLHSVKADDLAAWLYDGSDYFSMVHSQIGKMSKSKIDGGDGTDGVNLFNNKELAWAPPSSGIDGTWYWTAADPLRTSTKSPSRNDASPTIPT